jgi:hypothetical protein
MLSCENAKESVQKQNTKGERHWFFQFPPHGSFCHLSVHGTRLLDLLAEYVPVRQKYLTNLQNSCEWSRWCGKFVVERPSSETQSISVAMERWSVASGFCCGDVFQKQQFFRVSEDISSALQYSSERVSLCRNTSSSEDISKARCTKINKGQRRIWERTSGKKWQQFIPTCCNE